MVWASRTGERFGGSWVSRGPGSTIGSEPTISVTVSFEVLGPVLAVRDGNLCDLGGRRQRMVLAILLANVNAVVSRDALIEAIWAGDPPAAARVSLHTYVSHLRDALGAGVLTTRDGGYIIECDPDALDALRFESMSQEARNLMSTDPARAAVLFDHALGLWGGCPYGGLGDEPALLIERERLVELRLLAIEDRFDSYLQLARHAEIIADLRELVREHPYRERLHGQLMVALYRCGRQAEALLAFAELRQRLGDDLGIDPTPELWALEERILAHDPELESQATPRRAGDQYVGRGVRHEEIPPPRVAAKKVLGSVRPRRRSIISLMVGVALVSTSLMLGETQWAEGLRGGTGGKCVAPPAKMTAWWSGDENGVDRVGNRTATMVHGASFEPGLVGEAFHLDGSAFVDIPHDPSLDPGTKDFTIDLWARFEATTGEQVLVEKWIQTWSDRATMGWTFTKLEDHSVGFFSESLGSAFGVRTDPLDLPTDIWTHFAARRSGNELSILVDGEVAASHVREDGGEFHIGSVASMKMGHRGSVYDTSGSLDSRGFYLRGDIDELHLYVGAALTDGDIWSLVEAAEYGYCRA